MARPCLAPRMALYFAPTGMVYACDRTRYPLGSLAERSLRQIWEGARRQAHIGWVSVGDLSHGCSDCDQPEGEWTQSSTFDDRVKGPLSGFPEYLDFALSNRCNLQCVMCDGELSSTIRSRREGRPPLPDGIYDDRFFAELRDFLPHVREASFKGGEPFLTPLTFRVLDLLGEVGSDARVIATTNGTIWNDQVEAALRERKINIFLSVDGVTAATVESIRVGVDHARLRENIARFRAVTREVGSRFVLNYCLMDLNWHELAPFLAQARDEGDEVSVLPVLAPPERALLRLPQAELARIVQQMEVDGDRLGLNGSDPTWDAQVQRLRDAHEQSVGREGISVEVSMGRRRSDPGDRSLAPDEAMQRWGDPDPLRLTLHDLTVVEVAARDGAVHPLATGRWIGQFLDETFLTAVSDVLGEAESIVINYAPGREFDIVARYPDGLGVREVRAIGLPSEMRDEQLTQTVLVGHRARHAG